MPQPIAIAKLRKIRCARMSTFLSIERCGVSARKVLRLLLNKCNSGRFASRNNEKGVGLFLQSVCSYISTRGSIRRHARLHEEAPGSQQSPRRGLAVNSWVGGKGRPPREMETAPREWSRLPLTAESRPSVRAPPLIGDLRRRECGIHVAVGCRP